MGLSTNDSFNKRFILHVLCPRYYDDTPLVCGRENTSLHQFRLTAKLIRPVCIDYLRQLPRTGVVGQDTPDRDPFSQSLLFLLVFFLTVLTMRRWCIRCHFLYPFLSQRVQQLVHLFRVHLAYRTF
jgi:hypothetical protein